MPSTHPSPPAPDARHAAELCAFSDALGDFMRAIRRARGRFAAERPAGELSLSQLQLLETIATAGRPLPVSELALGAGVAGPTATRMLGQLEVAGLVVRRRCADDRRVVRVELTDLGCERVTAKRARVEAWRRELFASLPAAERRQAARLLHRLAEAVEDIG